MATPALVARPLRLEPFRALLLAPSRIGAQASARAFARPYTDVADRFEAWRRSGQVRQDDEPALYLHEYTASGITVRGLVGALDLTRTTSEADHAAVYPHEGVHPARAAELADTMAAMGLNPAPILLTHRAPGTLRALLGRIRTPTADHQFTDRSGQYHRIWAIRAPEHLEAIAAGLEDTHAVIADGHHRYAAYADLRAAHPELAPATDAGLAMLVDQDDTPLYLGAIHRILHGLRFGDLASLGGPDGPALGPTLGPDEAVAALGPHVLVVTDGHSWATLPLPHGGDRLAVERLHEDLLRHLRRPPSSIGFAHSVDDALRAVARRRGIAVLMPAPDFGDVLDVVEHGRLLPEKATSFQPKPSVGVLIRTLHDAPSERG